jgi:phosphate acetyltransferase
VRAAQEGVATVTLLGSIDAVHQKADSIGLKLDTVDVIDPRCSVMQEAFSNRLYDLRHHKGLSMEEALHKVREPLCFANLMVRSEEADGSVAGAAHATADVVRNALQVIGLDPDYKLVSSFFLMMLCEPFHSKKGGLIFSDCGLVVEPEEKELAEIAIAAADSARNLLLEEPRVAMLSFSTSGSAQHEREHKVVNATKRVRAMRPGLAIDGDVQLDAAIIADIADKKIDRSLVGGHANVLVFPNLEAGNIGYKLAERIGGAKAIGPLLQGLRKPANDLSRGCTEEDIYYVIAVTVVQSQASSKAVG